jgi:murein DD-endopeptidase MepM/ murein hydrolase activator NlpD
MQLIITDAWLAKSRSIQVTLPKLVLSTLLASLVLVVVAGAMYHWVFLKGAREGWPVVGALLQLVVKDEFAQRDRFMRENLDVLARQVGEMQAKVMLLESLGERVSGLAGIKPIEKKNNVAQGGALVSSRPLSSQQLLSTLKILDTQSLERTELFTSLESRLFDQKMQSMMIPTQLPVLQGDLGSAFGWRIDPFSGTSALHTGLDFQANPGTPIVAAAGGVVVTQEFHPAYGNMVEIDHGNDLVTRYAHASKTHVKRGDLIKRGQKIAEVGSTGRSTGPHLHFEVWVQGVAQDPQKFLAAGKNPQPQQVARVDSISSSPSPVQSLPVDRRLLGQR